MNAPTRLPPSLRDAALIYAAHQLDVTHEELLSGEKHNHLVHARALFVWAVKSHRPNLSYALIGRWLGDRHHSTIMNLHKKAIALRLSDADFNLLCERFALVWKDLTEASHDSTGH